MVHLSTQLDMIVLLGDRLILSFIHRSLQEDFVT